jgi:hypothetical protein
LIRVSRAGCPIDVQPYAASSVAPILSDHAAQNLRTTSIGLSIWLLLSSIWVALDWAPIDASPAADTIPARPTAL